MPVRQSLRGKSLSYRSESRPNNGAQGNHSRPLNVTRKCLIHTTYKVGMHWRLGLPNKRLNEDNVSQKKRAKVGTIRLNVRRTTRPLPLWFAMPTRMERLRPEVLTNGHGVEACLEWYFIFSNHICFRNTWVSSDRRRLVPPRYDRLTGET